MKRRLSLWVPVALYMALIFYLSSLSAPPLPEPIEDKTAHSVGYLGLGLLVARAASGGFGTRMRSTQAFGALTIAIAYGATDEWHQSFVPGRSAELTDLYADSIGAVAGVAGWWAWSIISVRSDVRQPHRRRRWP